MGREVRMVPANWEHPKYPNDYYRDHLRGRYVGLHKYNFKESFGEWMEGFEKWSQGLHESYGDGPKWTPIPDEYKGMRYSEYAGSCPSPDDYMPDWPESERTHYMMYEDTSEGTPISPAFATPEDLAQWLVDNEASAFGSSTGSYEHWLCLAKGGWKPDMVMDSKGLKTSPELPNP